MTRLETYIFYSGIQFIQQELKLKTKFNIITSEDRSRFKTFAYFDPRTNTVAVYTKNRAIADVLRSIFHEIVHAWQHENGRLTGNEPDIGEFDNPNDIENEANAKAGSIVKKFGYILLQTKKIDIYNPPSQ